jgi:hypothetical protein
MAKLLGVAKVNFFSERTLSCMRRSRLEGRMNELAAVLSQYDVTEEDAEQPISTHPDLQYCGAACLAFGLVALKSGMSGARKI